jgi:amidase
MPPITAEQSGAFVEQFTLPPTRSGPLSGLRFAVKDLIDVAGRRTSCGNPTWLATRPTAAASAVCVDQLLASGAECAGKVLTDEVAFSLLGQNHFYGTPLNPAAPDRVPGGSSSGSASAVACGHVDFALGTDTGGSVRIPANNCGIWGLRPSHDCVSVAGVMPFAPSLDTVGILARELDVLLRASSALLSTPDPPSTIQPRKVFLVRDAFDYAEPEIGELIRSKVQQLAAFGQLSFEERSLGELCDDAKAADFSTWLDTYRALQGFEVQSTLGGWIAETKPKFGPATQAGFDFVATLDRSRIAEVVRRREHYCRRLNRALASGNLLCFPTSPFLPPLKDQASYDRRGEYYRRTLSVTSIAGIGRLPEVTIPIAQVDNVPVGLSFAAARGEDMNLLEFVQKNVTKRPPQGNP